MGPKLPKLSAWWKRLTGMGRATTAGETHNEHVVTVTEQNLVSARPDGVVERMAWADLARVEVETDDGPLGRQVWFILHDEKQAIHVPQGGLGGLSLMARLQELPGWDNNAIRTAMKSAAPYRCRCWTRENKGWQPRRKR